jgi:hypothetical protein
METKLKQGSSLIDPALDIRLSVRVIPYGQVLLQKGQTLSSFTTWILALSVIIVLPLVVVSKLILIQCYYRRKPKLLY